MLIRKDTLKYNDTKEKRVPRGAIPLFGIK